MRGRPETVCAPRRHHRDPRRQVVAYLFGIDYGPRDLRLALLDASEGRISSPLKRALLYCYHYDLATGRYSLAIMRVVQLAGAATVVTLGTLIFVWTTRAKAGRLRAYVRYPAVSRARVYNRQRRRRAYFFLVGLSVVMSVLIATLVVTFAIKFRRRQWTKWARRCMAV